MISQEVKHADASTVANCHLCNHHFLNLYEIKESADEEKTLFAAVTHKHQIETDRVIGGIGSASAVTMLRDALLSTALYVCLACAAPVLGARYQRREAQEIAHKTKPSNTDATAATPMTVALAGVGRIEVPESEAIPAGSMLVACEMATDSAQCEISTRQLYMLWKNMWRQPHPSTHYKPPVAAGWQAGHHYLSAKEYYLRDTGRPFSTSACDYCLISSSNLAWYIHRPPAGTVTATHPAYQSQSQCRATILSARDLWRVHVESA
jgi:hypothetical protein